MAWKARINRVIIQTDGAEADCTVFEADLGLTYPLQVFIPAGTTLQDARQILIAAASVLKTRHTQSEALLQYVGAEVDLP